LGGSYVKLYDENWQFTGVEKKLYDRPGDKDIAFDGMYFYLYTGDRILKFDTELNQMKNITIPSDPDEKRTDYQIDVVNGKVITLSEYRENNTALWKGRQQPYSNIPPNSEVDRAAMIRIFDTNLNLLLKTNLVVSVAGAVPPNQYWAMGVSAFSSDGHLYLAVHAPVGNYAYFNVTEYRGDPPTSWPAESAGARQVFVLKFDDDLSFLGCSGPLTDTDNDNYWCEGSVYEDGKYFISYTYRRPGQGSLLGPQAPRANATFTDDQGNIRLSIYDNAFKELATVDITDINVQALGDRFAYHRSSILKLGNKVYVPYDQGGGPPHLTAGFIQELTLKTAWTLP
jgi:hypothetical protein